MEKNVVILKLFPSIQQEVVHSILNIKGLKGIILETYGAGNATTATWFIETIQKAVQKGIQVINISQCRAGSVNMAIYEAGQGLEKIGVINGKDMTTESAITKLMYLLGQNLPANMLKKRCQMSLKGEIS